MEAINFVGLSKKEAQDLADQLNLIFRLIRVDEKNTQNYPEDEREDRICIEIDKGKISKAVLQ
jgi:hypothetical protein